MLLQFFFNLLLVRRLARSERPFRDAYFFCDLSVELKWNVGVFLHAFSDVPRLTGPDPDFDPEQ